MRTRRQPFRHLLLIALITLLSGCATVNGPGDHRDPLEGFNRAMYKFNTALDRTMFTPIAKGYQAIMPDPLDRGVTNFFNNLEDVVTVFNDLLQFQVRQAGSDTLRVLINSTIGLLGFIDVASGMGFDKHDEDFGQTLGYWGVNNGPYLMLPILGPSTLRDTAGMVVDSAAFDPIYWVNHVPTRNTLIVVDGIDTRADLLGASNIMEEAALDKYDFIKESYFQKRESAIHNGEIAFPE